MYSFRYIFTLLAAILFSAPLCMSSDDVTLVSEADSAYNRGDFADAVKLYSEICDKDGISSELLFNLGNAYSRGGDYGHALVSYMRARRLDPSNQKVNQNIEYIKYKVSEANKSELRGKKYSLDSEPVPFFSSVRNRIAADHSSDLWAAWSAVMFILFILALSAYVFTSDVLVRKIGFFGGIACLAVSLILMIFSFMAASYKSDEGVIVVPKVKLHTEASLASKESPVALTRGTCMKILDTYPADGNTPQWYKVKLNSDFIGWIQSSDFEPVGN